MASRLRKDHEVMGQINQQILDFFMFVFICPMAELVTASDCYPSGEAVSEGREFEPHWGRTFSSISSFSISHHIFS